MDGEKEDIHFKCSENDASGHQDLPLPDHVCEERGTHHYLLKQLTQLFHTGIFLLNGNELESFEEFPEYNPLYQNRQLAAELCARAKEQPDGPVVREDEHQVFFACIPAGDEMYYLVGPMSIHYMNRVERHRFYHAYGIDAKWEKGLHYHVLTEILQIVSFLTRLLTGVEYTDEQIAEANHLINVTREQEYDESVMFDIQEEDADIYRHTYQEERKLLDMVRQGNVEEAVRMSREMDTEIGRLGSHEESHWRNLLTIAATLCARAAIDGGLAPYIAYRVSGFYINKGAECKDIPQLLAYRNHAVEDLARRVRDVQNQKHTSSYTERCRDYVGKHYREKIYLDEIAGSLGISSSYLSRLFKKETGRRFQDYIVDVRVDRAANLLVYSEESLSRIAEYVNFPSQSYFGRVFKERKGMTPRQYRENNKPTEFSGENTGDNSRILQKEIIR